MSKNISFKEFMDKVEERINGYSAEMLREILMEWARDKSASDRAEFLDMLRVHGEKEASYEGLLDEISVLAEKAKNCELSEGWGWDDEFQEERDWGDESWADDVDEFFGDAHDAMMSGNYELVRDAYTLLFNILEAEHLPGSPDPLDMIDTDIDEARVCYLRCVYFSACFDERPQKLWEAMQRFSDDIGDDLNLKCIVNAGRKKLPDFGLFLRAWIEFLGGKKDSSGSYLLREAVVLSGGVEAIANFAREEGKKYPTAYVDWVKALENKKDYSSMLEAAKEGLAKVPEDYVVRAGIAKGMVRAGENLGDTYVQLTGWNEAFYSDPRLSYLLSLLSVAEERNRYTEKVEAAIVRIDALIKKDEKSRGGTSEYGEKMKSTASETLLNQAYLLAGRYRDTFELCRGKESMGWSYGSNAKGLAVPFFLMLLCKGDVNSLKNLKWIWDGAVGNVGEYYLQCNQDIQNRFRAAADKVFESVQLSDDEEDKYLDWCVDETGKRVDAIVASKHRGSYCKAAILLGALAEVLASRDMRADGCGLIEKYHRKYNHYSAFRKELKEATGM